MILDNIFKIRKKNKQKHLKKNVLLAGTKNYFQFDVIFLQIVGEFLLLYRLLE